MTEHQRHRLVAAERQDSTCFHCGQPMWVPEFETLAHFSARTRQSDKDSRLARAVAEEMALAEADREEAEETVIAACLSCSRQRRKPQILALLDLVRSVRLNTRGRTED